MEVNPMSSMLGDKTQEEGSFMIPNNQQNQPSQPGLTFAKVENRVLDILEQDILTKTERRLFWYLFKLDRFGDRFISLPSQGKIAKHLGVRRETINLAQAKLQKLGLFEFQVDGWKTRNLVAPKSNRQLDKSLRVLEKSNRVLEEPNRQLEKSNRQLEKSNSDIYKDRVRDRSVTDHNRKQITPLTPQGEPESACVPNEVEVEVLDPEPEFPTPVDSQDSKNTSSLSPDNKNNSEDKSSAAPCDNKMRGGSRANRTNPRAMRTNPRTLGVETRAQQARERLARDIQNNQDRVNELVERFESGEVVSFPRDDLRLLAGALIGEQVALYRLSGDINHGKQKDIDPDFVAHVEQTMSREARNASNAIGRIRNCEQNPLRWRELIELIAAWQGGSSRPTSTNGNSMSTDDFFALASEYEQEY
jgi:hypothetical protein